MDINNKTVVITGGAQGLGLAMATDLASAGANLALIDMQSETLQQAKTTLSATGTTVKTYTADVSNENMVEAAFDKIAEDFGNIHVLINNAGILRDALLLKVKDDKVTDKMSLSQFQSVIDVNLTGVFLCGREAAIKMVENNQGGVIINMSSVARAGNIGQTNYAAAKASVVAITSSWAKELGRFGIRVGAIAPGVIRTTMTDTMKPEAKQRLINMKPVGRLGEAEEIAHSARYIIENDFFTGRVIEVDGGLRL